MEITPSSTQIFPQEIMEILTDLNSEEAYWTYHNETSSVLGAIELVKDCLPEIIHKRPKNGVKGLEKLAVVLKKYKNDFTEILESEVLMTCVIWIFGEYEPKFDSPKTVNYPQFYYIDKVETIDKKFDVLYSVGDLNLVFPKSLAKLKGYKEGITFWGKFDELDNSNQEEIQNQFEHYLMEVSQMWKYIINESESLIKRLSIEIEYLKVQMKIESNPLNEVKSLIGKGNLDKAISQLLKLNDNQDYSNELFQLKSRKSTLEKDRRLGIITDEVYYNRIAKISLAILEIIKIIDDK